jgi:hypothetical protein
VELVLDGGSEDLVQLLGDLEEEVGVAVEGGLSVGELSDDVIGGSDVVEGVLVLLGSIGVGGGEDLVLFVQLGLLLLGLDQFGLGLVGGGGGDWHFHVTDLQLLVGGRGG